MNPVIDAMDIAWQFKCREEDMTYREVENRRREIDDARRQVDEKAEQLKTICQLSALVAGFAMVVMVEISLPEKLHAVQLFCFGASGALVIALMFMAMLNSSMMLIAIFKVCSFLFLLFRTRTQLDDIQYDCNKRELPFDQFWRSWYGFEHKLSDSVTPLQV